MQKSTWKSNSVWPEVKSLLETGKDVVVYDLETTGLTASKERIIELAAIKYQVVPNNGDYDLVEKDVYHQFFNPGRPLPDVIVQLTGITDADLHDKPDERDCIEDVASFFDGCIVAGYNILTFDNLFMAEYFGRCGKFFRPEGSIDCLKMAKNRLRLREDVENFKLVTIGHYFGIQFEAHSAIEDTRTTGKLVQLFVHEYAEEERIPDAIPKKGRLRPNIRTISFWQGFRGFARIYVNMDVGSIYYDIRSGIWGGKDVEVESLDMPWLEEHIFQSVGVSSENEFAKFKGSLSF